MPKPRVLIASVTAAPSDVLAAHLKTVQEAASHSDASCDFLYLIDPAAEGSNDRLGWVLTEAGAEWHLADPKTPDAAYAVSEATHHWSEGAFYWLGAQKEKLLEAARTRGYDYLWLTDSDLLVGPDTLASLLACQKPVVSAVFWTRWGSDQLPLPQVWRQHPYGFDGMGESSAEFLQRLERRELVKVRGLGACTLISRDALRKVSFAPIPSLPREGMWQGEDRAFCIRAEQSHVDLWADAWPDIFHVYRPSDTEAISAANQFLAGKTGNFPQLGDAISLTLEPLEEPNLVGFTQHVRGRLGALNLLPDLEAEILSMKIGDERLTALSFPASYPLASYRGQKRLVRIRLLGAKPYRKPLPDGLYSEMVATP